MACLLKIVILFSIFGFTLPARINVEDMDYNSLMELLSEYENDNSVKETQPVLQYVQEKEKNFAIQKPFISSLLAPNVEVLRLVEACIKLKGELASRISLLISDNWDLIRSVYNLVLGKVGSLHSFTLTGISVIRKILEFAVNMIGTWEVAKPAISFGFEI